VMRIDEKTGIEKTIDAGVEDKRLMIVEEEFAKVIQVMKREGNTLSTNIRQAWDGSPFHILTKTSPMRATGRT